jgi:hypothetical protein
VYIHTPSKYYKFNPKDYPADFKVTISNGDDLKNDFFKNDVLDGALKILNVETLELSRKSKIVSKVINFALKVCKVFNLTAYTKNEILTGKLDQKIYRLFDKIPLWAKPIYVYFNLPPIKYYVFYVEYGRESELGFKPVAAVQIPQSMVPYEQLVALTEKKYIHSLRHVKFFAKRQTKS